MVERRGFPRYRFLRQAVVMLPAASRSVTVRDLSMRGAMVEPVATGDLEGFDYGRRCTLRFLTIDGDPALAIPAFVARCSEDGRVGLEIQDIGTASRRML